MTINPTDTSTEDSPMFAPIPAWERGKKRRGFGRSAAAEPRSFAPSAFEETPETAPVIDSEVPIADAGFATAPVYATRTKAKSSSAPMAIAAGIVLIGGVAAAGWYYSQPHGQTGVAELTPGASTTTTTTSGAASGTASSDAAPPTQVAQNTPPPAVAKTTTTTRTAPARHAPTRSRAASDNGTDTSVNAPVPSSAQVPAAPVTSGPPMPLPTPGVAPPASAAALQPQAPLVLNPAPVTTAPAAPQTAPQAVTPAPTEVPQA